MPFEFTRLEIPDVVLIKPKVFGDERGFFKETYKQSDFELAGIPVNFVQENCSRSTKGVLRGLHYQKHPKAQGKLVAVTRGRIFDVAVDIRTGSPTFGKWVASELSSDNHHMMYVPVGFAHGFCALSNEVDLVYKITGGEYAPELERGVIWSDSEVAIQWPVQCPILSHNDRQLPPLSSLSDEFCYD